MTPDQPSITSWYCSYFPIHWPKSIHSHNRYASIVWDWHILSSDLITTPYFAKYKIHPNTNRNKKPHNQTDLDCWKKKKKQTSKASQLIHSHGFWHEPNKCQTANTIRRKFQTCVESLRSVDLFRTHPLLIISSGKSFHPILAGLSDQSVWRVASGTN